MLSQWLSISSLDLILGNLAVLVEVVQVPFHAVVGTLLLHVLVHHQAVLGSWNIAVLVGETPALKTNAVWRIEADLEQLAVDVALLVELILGPVIEWALGVLSATNVNLGEVNFHSEFVVSFDVLLD